MIDHIKFIIEDIAIVLSSLMMIYIVYQSLKFYQESHYKLSNSLSLFRKFYIKRYYNLLLIPFIFVLDRWYMQLIYSVYLVVIYLKYRDKRQLSRLKFTGRINRIVIFIIVFFTALGTLLMYWIMWPQLISLLAMYIVLMPVFTYVSGIILTPLERGINKLYHISAKRKIKKFNPLIIGITGSCGKTSVKNYLYELIRLNQMAFMSPKSYNTLNGVSITINEFLYANNSVLVLEMGATKLGDIEELVNFCHPKIGIITQIAPQHLSTFHSIDNIITEKMKLVEGLPSDGIGFLNYDSKEIRNYHVKNDCKIISFGTTQDCDYYASEIGVTLDGLNFSVNHKGKKFKVNSKIIGSHNVTNILAAIAVAMELNASMNEIIDGVYRLENVDHRLQIRTDKNITIIDDAYNSNPLGFRKALEVLNLAKDYKTIITPGIVDAGKETKKINYDLSYEIAKICDEVILVDNISSRYILQGLEDQNYKKVKVVKSFKEGYELVRKGTLLIENDLTDHYLL